MGGYDGASCFSVALPDDDRFEGTSCLSMFIYLLKRWNCTFIAIYRHSENERIDNYVLLNPRGSIKSRDVLFVLGSVVPVWDAAY